MRFTILMFLFLVSSTAVSFNVRIFFINCLPYNDVTFYLLTNNEVQLTRNAEPYHLGNWIIPDVNPDEQINEDKVSYNVQGGLGGGDEKTMNELGLEPPWYVKTAFLIVCPTQKGLGTTSVVYHPAYYAGKTPRESCREWCGYVKQELDTKVKIKAKPPEKLNSQVQSVLISSVPFST